MNIKASIIQVLVSSSLFIALAPLSVAKASEAELEYSNIRNNLNVMSQIIIGTLKGNQTCDGCQIQISTNYLAKQGMVFTVAIQKNRWGHSFSKADGNTFFVAKARTSPRSRVYTGDLEYLEELAELEALELIPGLVEGILSDVGASFEEVGTRMALEANSDREINRQGIEIERSNRGAKRELKRKQRGFEYQIRDLEIEMLHTNDEQEQVDLTAKIEKIEIELRSTKQTESLLDKKYAAQKTKYQKARAARKEAINKENNRQIQLVQDLVMQTFCDYGNTLKYLPSDERVSLIFKQQEKSDSVFVIKKSQISNCSGGEELANKALSYLF